MTFFISLIADLLRESNFKIRRDTVKSKNEEGPSVLSFPFVKRDAVRLLAAVCENSRRAQDEIRSLEGIPLILSQCNYDDNNPCE